LGDLMSRNSEQSERNFDRFTQILQHRSGDAETMNNLLIAHQAELRAQRERQEQAIEATTTRYEQEIARIRQDSDRRGDRERDIHRNEIEQMRRTLESERDMLRRELENERDRFRQLVADERTRSQRELDSARSQHEAYLKTIEVSNQNRIEILEAENKRLNTDLIIYKKKADEAADLAGQLNKLAELRATFQDFGLIEGGEEKKGFWGKVEKFMDSPMGERTFDWIAHMAMSPVARPNVGATGPQQQYAQLPAQETPQPAPEPQAEPMGPAKAPEPQPPQTPKEQAKAAADELRRQMAGQQPQETQMLNQTQIQQMAQYVEQLEAQIKMGAEPSAYGDMLLAGFPPAVLAELAQEDADKMIDEFMKHLPDIKILPSPLGRVYMRGLIGYIRSKLPDLAQSPPSA
jgi:hypothetical protein